MNMQNKGKANVAAAAERFFRLYENHCLAPNRDTLFNFMEASHSLSDRMEVGIGQNLLDVAHFSALKCLRNLFHHHEELLNRVRLVPTTGFPISTDMLFLCLVPRETVETAIEQSRPKYRKGVREACENCFHWYGPVVNINPCIFNFGVAVFEKLNQAEVPLVGDAANRFRDLYEMEEEEGLSHFVDGRISTSVGTIGQLMADLAETDISEMDVVDEDSLGLDNAYKLTQ